MTETDILLIEPPSILQNIYREKGKKKVKGHLPNLGLCSIAAVLEKKGYRVKILDALALNMNVHECAEAILQNKPRYIGISATTQAISSAAQVAAIIKQREQKIV